MVRVRDYLYNQSAGNDRKDREHTSGTSMETGALEGAPADDENDGQKTGRS